MSIIKAAGGLFLMAVGGTLLYKGGKFAMDALTNTENAMSSVPKIVITRTVKMSDISEKVADVVKETSEAVQS